MSAFFSLIAIILVIGLFAIHKPFGDSKSSFYYYIYGFLLFLFGLSAGILFRILDVKETSRHEVIGRLERGGALEHVLDPKTGAVETFARCGTNRIFIERRMLSK